MRQDKDIAFKLRKEGKTYRKIQSELGISKSTLCEWFRDIPWSNHIKHKNNLENKRLSTERLDLLNAGRKKKLEELYEKVLLEAEKEYQDFKNEPLFMAGLMVYAGEGDKLHKNLTRISNSEFYLHKVFILFLEKYLHHKRENIKIGLILYPDHNVSECINTWSKELKISEKNFHKPQVIKGKELKRRLQYGVGMSIISITVEKKKLMKWIDLYRCELNNEY